MRVIGIDPGVTGALAMLNGRGLVAMADMPIMQRTSGGAYVKNQVNPAGLTDILREWTADTDKNAVMVVIELQRPMPAVSRGKGGTVKILQGGASIFYTGLGAGLIEGVVAARGYPHKLVPANVWKKALQVTATKEHARAEAARLYPTADIHRKKDHNRAEAILIAHYGWRQYA